MALITFNSDAIDAVTVADLGETDDVRVEAGVLLVTSTVALPTIRGTGNGHSAIILGTVISFGGVAVQLGDMATDTGQRLVVGSDGFLLGHIGARIDGSGSEVINRGIIAGTFLGLSMGGFAGEARQITNFGTIKSDAIGIGAIFPLRTVVLNEGRITGGILAYEGNNIEDLITNNGVMAGAIDLLGGNDLYDGHAGRVNGSVTGGFGNDRFLPGTFKDVFDGASDRDTLDFSRSKGVTVFLDGSGANTGVAKGDSYLNFEIVRGSARFADRITGSGNAEALTGLGGRDRLNGRDGSDDLTGGRGADTLSGGNGAGDQFIYNSKAEGGDRISDFSGLAGAGDRFEIRAAGFGGGLDAGTLEASQFRIGRTNQAQDRSDRFIFRTTDETLWFDRDGKGGKGPVLIADLQDGAVVTAADILLV